MLYWKNNNIVYTLSVWSDRYRSFEREREAGWVPFGRTVEAAASERAVTSCRSNILDTEYCRGHV